MGLSHRLVDAGADRGGDCTVVWGGVSSVARVADFARDGLECPEAPAAGAGRSGESALAGVRVGRGQKKAQVQGQGIVFLDETGFLLKPGVRRSGALRGQTPVFPNPSRWASLFTCTP